MMSESASHVMSTEGNEDPNDGWRTRLESLESNVSNDPHEPLRESEATSAEKQKTGWYPGKYLGRSRPPEKEKKFSVQDDEMEGTKQDIEDQKQEAMIVRTIRAIRTKYLERQLVGRIYIYRMSGVIATAVTSEITRDDIMDYLMKKVEREGPDAVRQEDPLIQAELEKKYKRALSTTDTILNSLERRSLSWEGCEFSANTLLTRGSTIGVSDPFIGMIAFSFTLELSATAHSLLASRKRYEATRELARCSFRASSLASADPDVAAALAATNANNAAAATSGAGAGAPAASEASTTRSTSAESAERKSYFSWGSSSSSKKTADPNSAEARQKEDEMEVEISDIYSEPIHSLAQQPPLMNNAPK